jgi:excisionase family DNA binding protein
MPTSTRQPGVSQASSSWPTASSAASVALSLDEPLLDVNDAAALLNVRVSWIREATRTGLLPCLHVGRHVRYTRGMLESWLASRGAAGTGRTER